MMEENVFSAKRFGAFLFMGIGVILLSAFYTVWYHFTLDEIITIVLLHCLFYPVFILFLETERRHERLYKNDETLYISIRKTFLCMIALYMLFPFFPAYTIPVMIPAFFLTLASNMSVGMVASLYLNVLLCLVSECSTYELSAYIILTFFGCLIATLFEKKRYRFYLCIMVMALFVSIPGIFYYLDGFKIDHKVLMINTAAGVVSVILYLTLYSKITDFCSTETVRSLKDIIDPEYPLAQEIKSFSDVEYAHAINVSNIAYQCAKIIHADEDVAAAAGFYYRLGKIEGEPFVENGVMIAREYDFPHKVITILGEYNGEKQKPTTRESAIVHMVDTVIARFEFLDKETLSSTWNRDIVVYKTLNEISTTGLYDDSGLSMNQYLKIREYLVKGVKLL